jgi:hypothetical protein
MFGTIQSVKARYKRERRYLKHREDDARAAQKLHWHQDDISQSKL